jgi:hypothetical protein
MMKINKKAHADYAALMQENEQKAVALNKHYNTSPQ